MLALGNDWFGQLYERSDAHRILGGHLYVVGAAFCETMQRVLELRGVVHANPVLFTYEYNK